MKMNFKHKDATKYGIDIAKGRVDNLDKDVIRFAIGYKGKKVAVDIGSGQSRLSVILALLGFEVWCYDIEDHSRHFATLDKVLGLEGRVHFVHIDISTLTHSDLPHDIVVAVSQRTLHHLQYTDVKNVLSLLYNKMTRGGRLYLSLSGLGSKLSGGYECADSPVESRFCEVGEVGKKVYSIGANVCLYTTQEVQELVEECKFTVTDVIESNFGNVKAKASK